MILSEYINTKHLQEVYAERTGKNFATYYNVLTENLFKIHDKNINYLYNKDVNFGGSTKKYIQSLTRQYTYTPEDVDAATVYAYLFRDDTDAKVSVNEPYLGVKDQKLSIYKWIRFENYGGDLNVFIPNQANWNIDIYINELGELIINTDNE